MKVFVFHVMCGILWLTCSPPLLVSSSWVDTSLINSCEDKEFSIVRHFFLFITPKSPVCRWEMHHSHYISLTRPLRNCQRIIQNTIQSGRVLSAPATTLPSSLRVVNHRPQEYSCKPSHQKQVCFSHAAIALVLTPAVCQWHEMNAAWGGGEGKEDRKWSGDAFNVLLSTWLCCLSGYNWSCHICLIMTVYVSRT